MNKPASKLVTATLSLGLIAAPIANLNTAYAAGDSTLKLSILETTDIHTNLMSYDYYKDGAAPTVGLSRTASLVKEVRAKTPNTFLVDNGDLIQGTPLGTYVAKVAPLAANDIHPVYKAMNLMGYDAATLGNHEFNYGLDFLNQAMKGANFPYINANVYVDDHDSDPNNDVNRYEPYRLIKKTFKDEAGQDQTLTIGVIGFAPPQIMDWDKASLEGKVVTKDIVETAEKFVPKMRSEGADIVIAMAHTGFNGSAAAHTNAEDAVLPLSKVPGIDAITFSHTHKVFPADDEKSLDALFKDASGNVLPGVDNAKGKINGVPAVQAGYGGSNLGIIDLTLEKQNGVWKVAASQSSTKAIYDKVAKKSLADEDQAIVDAVKADHEATIAYANNPIGTTTAPIHSYFALVQDDPSVQIVTNAQKWYVEKYVKANLPKYKDTPILSVGAPFKAGRNGVEEFTEIKKGPLAIKSAGDLYLYDNTMKAILVKGSVVKEWLEMSAGKFNRIDPASKEEQALLNPSFPVYNFDVIDGVTYQVDVTKPAKYKTDGTVNDASASRIVNLKYQGKAVDPNQEFIVVTNNYRASGGGNFPGVKGSEYLIDSTEENRQILMDYISENKEINPSIDNNWSIAPIYGDVNVTFASSPKAEDYAKATGNIGYLNKTDDKGFGIYEIDLNKTFADVPSTHWAFPYVQSLAAKQIVQGKTDTKFDPQGQVTRAEFATMLVKALKLTSEETAMPFKDVASGSWYAGAVAAAYENGLIQGISADRFAPTKNISREQMAVMAHNALKIIVKDAAASKPATFADNDAIGTWAKASVDMIADKGIMTGRGQNKFAPQATSNRAEAAKVVELLLDSATK
ncbi:bifunctional 2',3'-cyclic-nucleotide 2'-phosphodiesterase/3'-nucleotidase [Cohnella sp. GCM10027633]|uniref:bifunctional 2',3'-cyclic-nucleotide 2'-phosphodiesterase/3'-nucleotidase n=1 Tax=unclassified Cohnella TaxID=2636738 RepID=UPI0036415802